MQFWVVTILFVFSVLAVGWYTWKVSNSHGSALRGRKRPAAAQQSAYQVAAHGRRSTDSLKLSRHEKMIVRKAQKAIADGQIQAAAQIYESMGLLREAVSLLEENSYIHEAAKMLARFGYPNRAGVVYGRHQLWLPAAECFRIAKMPMEQAKCLMQGGKTVEAAEIFKKLNKHLDAAECYVLAKLPLSASEAYFLAGEYNSCFKSFLDASELNNQDAKIVAPEYANFLSTQLNTVGRITPLLIKILDLNRLMIPTMRTLLNTSDTKLVTALLLLGPDDLPQKLIVDTAITDVGVNCLAGIFADQKKWNEAGILLQRLGRYLEAASAFEKAHDPERAIYCYERGGELNHARRVKEGMSKDPSTTPAALDEAHISIETSDIDIDLHQQTHVDQDIEDTLKSAFNQAVFLQGLPMNKRDKIWRIGKTLDFEKGQCLLNYDDLPKGLYVIIEGKVDCYRSVNQQDNALDSLYISDTIGELWLFAAHPTSVKFIAQEKVKARLIPKDDFKKLLDNDGFIARKVFEHFTHRLLKRLLSSGDQNFMRAS